MAGGTGTARRDRVNLDVHDGEWSHWKSLAQVPPFGEPLWSSVRRVGANLRATRRAPGILLPMRLSPRPVFRPSAAPLLVLLALGLGGCARPTDTFTPRIVIGGPGGSAVSQSRTPTVRGYALDDVGVTRVTVDGKAMPLQAGSRKIAVFSFQPAIQGDRGQYTVRAYDAAGHVGELSGSVRVDAQKPQIQVTSLERSGRQIRVNGVAVDAGGVTAVSVDGQALSIQPGSRVAFSGQTSGVYADITVRDAAGNTATLRAR